MNDDLRLVAATRSDAGLLARMHMELVEEEDRHELADLTQNTKRMLEAILGYYRAVLVHVGEECVGYVLYHIDLTHIFLSEIYLNPAARGQGYGTALLNRLLDNEWSWATRIHTEVSFSNQAGRKFFEDLGFSQFALHLQLDTTKKSSTRKACGAVVFRKRWGRVYFLLIQQINGDLWGFPKGHMDEGETEEETAVREVEEETGIRIAPIDGFCERVEYLTSKYRRKEVVYFLAQTRTRAVHIPRDEIKAYRWLRYEDARRQLTYGNSRILIDKAYQHILEYL